MGTLRFLAGTTLALGLALAGCQTAPPALDGPVATTSGRLKGVREGDAVVFRGVPYARPPVGDLRWAPPQPLRWDGVRQATDFGLPCLQPTPADGRTPNGGGVAGASAEDCLTLNIWSPATARKAPVMVWLYGGGGTMGAGSAPTYDGSAFARDGVVLVTLNYRHGALAGFAHPAIAAANGAPDANFHLLDAIAALKWVRANAAALGGDPANITLFGESAGATMTANLVTSPLAAGLFEKAIIQSTGSLPTPGTSLERAQEIGAAFATSLGLPGADATIAQLRALPAQQILEKAGARGGLRTIIDGTAKTHSIMDAFERGEAADIPMLIGTNSDEGRLAGTQRVASLAMTGAPVWQYFFDYVPEARRAANPNGAPHAGEIAFVFDTLERDARLAGRVSADDQKVADLVHACWVAFAKLPAGERTIGCNGFSWPARTPDNGQSVAVLGLSPTLAPAPSLRSPPNGAKPGPTSRDQE